MPVDLMEKYRKACLARGATGILSIGRLFKIKDDDGSRTLCYSEFEKAAREYGLNMSKDEIKIVFNKFDRDGSGKIDFEEFLFNLRVTFTLVLSFRVCFKELLHFYLKPPMNSRRIALINQAFDRMDKNKDGIINYLDLIGTKK
jgi:calcyphosin